MSKKFLKTTPDEFKAWLKRNKYTHQNAGELLGCKVDTLRRRCSTIQLIVNGKWKEWGNPAKVHALKLVMNYFEKDQK